MIRIISPIHTPVDINGKGHWTALMVAARSGHADCVRVLLECGADVNAKTAFNSTSLMFACEKGHVECVRALLAAGANVHNGCVFTDMFGSA